MAMFDFVINDQSVGQTIGPADGFLVNLTTPSPKYEVPQWSESKRLWLSAYFVSRGSLDYRDLYCTCSSQNGLPSKIMAQGKSLGYSGGLIVVCVPKGSAWAVTWSDIPYGRPPPPTLPGGTAMETGSSMSLRGGSRRPNRTHWTPSGGGNSPRAR